jgi:hypothetical protein
MHSKAIDICTLKFLGCQLAQRVHGSKVEAKESTENSEALNWRVKIKFIASDDPTSSFLDASDEFCGQGIQNGQSDEPTVQASVHLTP